MPMKNILRIILVTLFIVPFFPLFLYRTYGNKRYRLTGNTIIVCNHYSNFDPLFIQMKFYTKKIRFIALKGTKRKIHLRFITWLFDCIYVDQDKIDVNFFKTSIQSLSSGKVICIFPEGVVNPRKFGLFDFKQSYLRLAKKTGAKILPLYLYPELKWFKRSKLYIGDELIFDYHNRDSDIINTQVMSILMDYEASL